MDWIKKDFELCVLFYDSFSCPLCRHKPLTISRAYIDEAQYAVFELYCRECDGHTEFFMAGNSLEDARKRLMKGRELMIKRC